MFEHTKEPLFPRDKNVRRVAKRGLFALPVILFLLTICVAGYHFFEELGWIDSILNASMILGGMGPVNELHTNAGKIFASTYTAFSGVIFLVPAGVLLFPILHRFLHKFHLDDGSR